MKDDELSKYLDSFIYEAEIRGVHIEFNKMLVMKFHDFKRTDIDGKCVYTTTVNLIKISRDDFDNHTDTENEITVFHELGHCILGRQHFDERHPSWRKKSIMHTFAVKESDYLAHRAEYLDELFQYESTQSSESFEFHPLLRSKGCTRD